ncbi:restnol dehydrogenase, putative [Entamoeba invadens IP1]|uniref:Restnol dehydrogenase, putative n=2 Tax=Entamoeba invadens TaxID=33085 RepID=A0A0A1U165_ENTIV|nr:restnol dehydrogenase, putative [Entamoeba invadens IP1]ELP87792.1 restnol dehydrogenase, putative [Entamoeba invadens IP1]BAN40966.1 restnol dehydrogenase, putative [Entamoeba invadens]BAN41797.1 restnol dehydrogenase, putative [Entamoeba invadens]|eukprot:XP_004254563.1 restnol dehydrogenase, putative [Entamoeba invadens IP1]
MFFFVGVTISLVIIVYCIYMFCRGGTNINYPDLTGKIVVVTGTNRGIGYETVKELAKQGATVVCCCRHEEAQIRVNMIIGKETGNKKLEFVKCDLMDLACVKKAAEYINTKYHKVDILITNAGIMCSPFALSKQNVESQMATNHIGHAAFIQALLPSLLASDSPRLVAVSSVAHKFISPKTINLVGKKENYKPAMRYFESKLAVGMFINEFAKEHKEIVAVHVHPGIVYSNLWKDWHPWLLWVLSPSFYIFWKNPKEACQTTLHCALADKNEIVSGGYYADCKLASHNKLIDDTEMRQKLYKDTLEFIKQNE